MNQLKAWADGPFDLIVHAESCLRKGSDFDRRIALILFDNSIEVSIITHLNLHPVQRKNIVYQNVDVATWSNNFHTKLDFLFDKFIADNGCTVSFDRADLIHCHDIRNGQYHAGGSTIPRARELDDIRKAALETFAILFDIPDVENLLDTRITELDPSKDLPSRSLEDDKIIDMVYGTVEIGGQTYYTSEALYGIDPFAYGNLVIDLKVDAWMEAEGGDGDENN
ncbi:MAG TPA: hypothetical protein PLK77_02195 [Pyrinomonadaceae bacterium]|nr:hypothetical protein [Pyrinomonadaceae bacterium]